MPGNCRVLPPSPCDMKSEMRKPGYVAAAAQFCQARGRRAEQVHNQTDDPIRLCVLPQTHRRHPT